MFYTCYEDVVQLGEHYIRVFIQDYYEFIFKFDVVVSPDDFAREWTCLPPGTVERLKVGKRTYLKAGPKFFEVEVTGNGRQIHDSREVYYVTARLPLPHPQAMNDFHIDMGGLYFYGELCKHNPLYYPESYPSLALSKFRNGGNLCPTRLITTKTKEP